MKPQNTTAPRFAATPTIFALSVITLVLSIVILTQIQSTNDRIQANTSTISGLQSSLDRIEAEVVPDHYLVTAAIEAARDSWDEGDLDGAKDALSSGIAHSPSDPKLFNAIVTMANQAHDRIASADELDRGTELVSFRDTLIKLADTSVANLPLEAIQQARGSLTELQERVRESGDQGSHIQPS